MMEDEEIDDLYKILNKWTIDLEDIPDYNVKLAYLQFILQSAKECIMTNRNKIIYTDCKGRQDWHYSKSVGLGFVARDAAAKKKQETHQIMFKIIRNDQTIQNGKYLVDLKNIFARQLPKMPKQYIVKLVFDKHHESMVILKNGETVLGGISFRQFTEERFTQIAFLAITSTEQVKGFGTRLMNKLKQQMQKRKIQFLITYADNLALGYFKKQGFSKDSLMVQERWKGFIKDYQGGTMMQCKIHPTINYNLISDIIKKQKLFIVDKIKELSINKNKYKGQKIENMIKEPFLRLSSQGEHEYFKINPLQIPGIKQSGWNWEQHDEFIKSQQSSFAIQCQNIIDSLKRHPSSWPFRQPVSQEDVPDYYMIIKDPIDLKTIERKLNNQQYKNHNRFIEDIMAIFRNCRLYNQPQTLYYRHSNELQEFVKPLLQDLDRVDNGEIKEKRILFNKTSKKKNQKKQTRMDIQ